MKLEVHLWRFRQLFTVAIIALGMNIAYVPSVMAKLDLEEIIVTAQKRSESLLDVPVAVTAINSKQIEGAGNLIDIQSSENLVPSLQIRRGNGNRESTLIMRGVGTISFSTAAEPSVAAVVDGVVLSRAGQAFNELVEIERLEVLRGPQGTLFGKNASAGVVNVISKGPTEENEAYVDFSWFEDDEFRVRAAVSGPLSDTVRYRLNAFQGTFDGHISNNFDGESTMGYDRAGVRGQLAVDASETLSLRFIADWNTRNDRCCADVLTGGADTPIGVVLEDGTNSENRSINQDHITDDRGDAWSIQMNADWEWNDHVITSITSYRTWEGLSTLDLDFGPNSFERGPIFEHDGGFFEQGIRDNGSIEVEQFSQEIRLASAGGEALDYTIGAYYFTSDVDRVYQRNAAACNDGGDGILDLCGEGDGVITRGFARATFSPVVDNFAVFGQGTYSVTEDLRVIFGARFTMDDLEYDFVRIRETEDGTAGLGDPFEFSDGVDNDDFSIKAGFQYDLSHSAMSYFTYSQGYKGPAYNLFLNFREAVSAPISEETADAFEIGFKSTLFNDSVILSGALYYALYDNFQANNFIIFDGALITNLTNAGKVETQGFELDFIAQPSDALSLSGGLAYTDATIDEFFLIEDNPTPERLATQAANEGTTLAFAPEWAFNLSGDYTFDLDGAFDVIVSAQYNYQTEMFTDIFQQPDSVRRVGSHGILNMGLTLRSQDENYAVTFHVKNLTDKDYVTGVSGGVMDRGVRVQVPRDADRYWGVSVRAGF